MLSTAEVCLAGRPVKSLYRLGKITWRRGLELAIEAGISCDSDVDRGCMEVSTKSGEVDMSEVDVSRLIVSGLSLSGE